MAIDDDRLGRLPETLRPAVRLWFERLEEMHEEPPDEGLEISLRLRGIRSVAVGEPIHAAVVHPKVTLRGQGSFGKLAD